MIHPCEYILMLLNKTEFLLMKIHYTVYLQMYCEQNNRCIITVILTRVNGELLTLVVIINMLYDRKKQKQTGGILCQHLATPSSSL